MQTDNIILKKLHPEHASLIFNTINSERAYLREWLPFVDETLKQEDSEAFVAFSLQNAKEKGEYVFAIFFDGDFAGLIGFRGTDLETRKTEIGYWLSEKLQHKGIITRACKLLVNYAFNDWGMETVKIHVATGNTKSQRIPAKLGFKQTAIIENGEQLVNGPTDIIEYVLTKEEYLKSEIFKI